MISDLKRKTASRDMYKVLSELEGREITPPRKNYSMSPPPQNSRNGKRPEPKKYGRYDDGDGDGDDDDDFYSAPRKSSNENRPQPRGGSYRYQNH
jgi:hypothetical protein